MVTGTSTEELLQEVAARPAPPPPPLTIRETTLGLPGAALDGCKNDRRIALYRLGSPWGRGLPFPEGRRRSTVQSSWQLLCRECHPSSDRLAAPADVLASSSFTSQLPHKGKELTGN